jgi:hypothetical protein
MVSLSAGFWVPEIFFGKIPLICGQDNFMKWKIKGPDNKISHQCMRNLNIPFNKLRQNAKHKKIA